MAAQKVKMQNFMKEELEERSKCSVCWQVRFHYSTNSNIMYIAVLQAASANWEFVSCLVICVLVWVFCLYLWLGCEVRTS